MELVSVMMTIYNSERFIDEALQSVLSIDYPNLEFVLVDDGSQDSSWDIANKYAEQDERIVIVKHERNLGVGQATKSGMSRCNGEYIIFAAADDITLASRVREILPFFRRNEKTGIVISNAIIINDKSEETGEWYLIDDRINSDNILIHQFRRNYCLGATMALKNVPSIIQKEGLLEITEDYPLSIEYILAGFQIELIRKPLIKYRIHDHNYSNQRSKITAGLVKVLNRFDSNEIMNVLTNEGYDKSDILNSIGIFDLFRERWSDGFEKLMLSRQCCLDNHIPIDFENSFYLGVAAFRNKELESSLSYMNEAYQTRNDDPTVLNNLAVLQLIQKVKKYPPEQLLSKCLEIDPNYLDARHNLNCIFKQQQNFKFTTRLMDSTRIQRPNYAV